MFVDKGFKKWKDAEELLKQHKNSKKHKDSKHNKMDGSKKHFSWKNSFYSKCYINTQRMTDVLENRNHIKHLILAISYLARQGLAYRGDDESKESSNRGNLIELLDVMSQLSPQLKKILQARYGHYLSAEYQNDIIHCLASALRKNR